MIGLMDCNNFFVSCERLFRPDLIGKPVIVLSSNDGCVVSRSQEVKDLGIPMGVPHFEIKDICKKERITVFSSNFALYRDISARVMNTLKSEFETCSVYSVDEAFFEADPSLTTDQLMEIRARIIQKTGIPVSIGIAKTKTLAKAVNRIAKKGTGVCILDDALYNDVILELLCSSIWGIGRQTSSVLSKHKVYTIKDLLVQDPMFIKKNLGIAGERICMELCGVRAYELEEGDDEVQGSYMSTRSFGAPVHDKQVLLSSLSYHVTHVAKKLRRDGCVAGRITVLVRGSRYGAFSHREGSKSVMLLEPTNSTLVLIKEASKLLDVLYTEEIPYRKAGVVFSDVRPVHNTSNTLFGDVVSKEKQGKIDTIIDTLTDKYGSEIVHSGLVYQTSSWKERRMHHSKEYTTKWSDIACVKAG
jgi:DNA polymerase V